MPCIGIIYLYRSPACVALPLVLSPTGLFRYDARMATGIFSAHSNATDTAAALEQCRARLPAEPPEFLLLLHSQFHGVVALSLKQDAFGYLRIYCLFLSILEVILGMLSLNYYLLRQKNFQYYPEYIQMPNNLSRNE